MSTVLVHYGLPVILIGAYVVHTSLFYRRISGKPRTEGDLFVQTRGEDGVPLWIRKTDQSSSHNFERGAR